MIKAILQFGALSARRAQQVDLEKDGDKLAYWIQDLKDTNEANNGAGLAAPQIGIDRRMFVTRDGKIVINPIILYPECMKEEMSHQFEGCLSLPDMMGLTERYPFVFAQWEYLVFEPTRLEKLTLAKISGTEAIVFQHEYDHLEGKTYIDRLMKPIRFGYTDLLKENFLRNG